MDIVLITGGDRPKLTAQTIESMFRNASNPGRHRLIVVCDTPYTEMLPIARSDSALRDVEMRYGTWIATGNRTGVGGAKNFGAAWLAAREDAVNRDPLGLLMFSDNDMYYLPRWDERLERGIVASDAVQLGGWKHPYHKIHSTDYSQVSDDGESAQAVWPVDAATGNCCVIRWQDWLRFGPFEANAVGPGQSEDYALSRKIAAAGGLVATTDPPVAVHCGIVNSDGQPATGWREMAAMAVEQQRQWPNEKIGIELPDGVAMDDRGQLLQVIAGVDRAIISPSSSIISGSRRTSAREMRPRILRGLNLGSGQRRYESTADIQWVNIDSQSPAGDPSRIPDVVCDVGRDQLPFEDGWFDYAVLHQVLEHAGCGEATPMLLEAWRVLQPGGSLIVTVPDMRALCGRWLGGEMDTQLFMTSVYGAYMGSDDDRHRWGFDEQYLRKYILQAIPVERDEYCRENWDDRDHKAELCNCRKLRAFDWRGIPGADIAHDWWILGVEAVKL